MDYSYWNYFLSLENDLLTLSRYVEFSVANFSVYSAEILKLFLATSSEFEVVMKELGKKYKFSEIYKRNANIETINNLINQTNRLQIMKNIEVDLHSYNLCFSPIQEICNHESWWKDYNAVKHERSLNYSKANLENVLKSISALFLAEVFFYEDVFHKDEISLDDNISITLANLRETKLIEFKQKKYYCYKTYSFFA